MAPRSELSALLKQILGSDQVYFQEPENVKMLYPAILYSRDDINVKHADNRPYALTKRYQVTVISRDPDSDIPDKIAALPLCSFSREYKAQNLYHYVFLLYF